MKLSAAFLVGFVTLAAAHNYGTAPTITPTGYTTVTPTTYSIPIGTGTAPLGTGTGTPVTFNGTTYTKALLKARQPSGVSGADSRWSVSLGAVAVVAAGVVIAL